MYYIHGFNSSANSRTAKLLNAAALGYDSARPFQENFASLKAQIPEDDAVAAGSSLGGFYAAALGVPAILINPCTWPERLLKAGIYTNHDTGITYELTREAVNSYTGVVFPQGVPRLVIIGLEDDIINPEENIAYWSTRAKVVTGRFGHRIESLEPFWDEIRMLEARGIFR